jgi:HK97 family phage major capsid protein
MDNRTLLQKADLVLNDLIVGGGYLKPAQALKFMRLLGKQSVLLGQATLVPMKAPKEQISKISLNQRILRPAQEAVSIPLAQRTKPDFSMVELDAKNFKAEVRLTDEQLEDNIERGDLRQTVMELIAEAVARDMEEVAVNGDVSNATDPFLATMDGVLKQAQSHVVDAANAPLTAPILTNLLKSLPSQYRRDKRALRFLTSVDAEVNYRSSLQQRETAVGDRLIEEDTPVQYSGVPIVPIPLFPEHLGANSNQSAVLLTNPKNIAVGVWRQIRMETGREISDGVLKIVVSLRFDTKLVDELATAKAVNLLVN